MKFNIALIMESRSEVSIKRGLQLEVNVILPFAKFGCVKKTYRRLSHERRLRAAAKKYYR